MRACQAQCTSAIRAFAGQVAKTAPYGVEAVQTEHSENGMVAVLSDGFERVSVGTHYSQLE